MSLGAKSRTILEGVHPDLRAVMLRAGDLTSQPFVVTEGKRSLARQRQLVKDGFSKTLNSRHLTGHAADVAAVVNGKLDFQNREPYRPIWDAVRQAASELGVPIEWGGNWKSFVDVFHFALPWDEYPKGEDVSYTREGVPHQPMKFENSLQLVLRTEGGWNADDPSNYGITLGTLDQWRPGSSLSDLRQLTVQEATKIYQALYWHRVRGDELPAAVDYAVFDYAVHSGPPVAIRALQTAVGVDADGILGPITLSATKAADPANLVGKILDLRLRRMQTLAGWAQHKDGWSHRIEQVRQQATAMLEQGGVAPPKSTPEVVLSAVTTEALIAELLTRPNVSQVIFAARK